MCKLITNIIKNAVCRDGEMAWQLRAPGTLFQFPAHMLCGSQPPPSLALEHLTPTSGLFGYQYILGICMYWHIQINKHWKGGLSEASCSGGQYYSLKTKAIKRKSKCQAQDISLFEFWWQRLHRHPHQHCSLPWPLVVHSHKTARLYCWIHHTLGLQCSEKSTPKCPESSLLASFCSTGRCYAGCWGRRDTDDLA